MIEKYSITHEEIHSIFDFYFNHSNGTKLLFLIYSSVNINQVFALVGFGTPNQAEITVDTIIIHPDYDLPLNDIAVVKV